LSRDKRGTVQQADNASDLPCVYIILSMNQALTQALVSEI